MTTAPLASVAPNAPAPVHVYWIYGEGMEPLYVGITSDLDGRLRTHSEKSWWSEVRRIDSRPYASREAAAEAERGEIKRLAPKWNIVHNAPARQPRRAPVPRVNSGGRRQLISLEQTADYLGVTTRTVRRYISEGRLTAYRVGGRLLRLDLADVDAMLSPVPTVGSWQ